MTHLHIHNHVGSRLDAIGSVEDYAQRAYEFGHPALAVTDHGRLSAIWENQKACKKFGIKPIIGVEMYIAEDLETFEPLDEKRIRTRNSHVILLVKNKKGYENLLYLNYLSMHDEKHFYYSPRISLEELTQHSEGLILGTGCLANPIISAYRSGEESKANKIFESLLVVFKSDLYVEVQLNELSKKIDYLERTWPRCCRFWPSPSLRLSEPLSPSPLFPL